MREDELIGKILSGFRRCPQQLNAPFTCDAEIVTIGGELWGITMDEFSPDEDLFGAIGVFDLGRNLAVGVLSDLLACGAEPKFYLHSLVTGPECSVGYVADLCRGISSVLEKAGCWLLGGDIGSGGSMRYTGTALGQIKSDRHISRVISPADVPCDLWVTGTLGDANFAAVCGEAMPHLELRLAEAAYIRQNALACIDTSGGAADAFWQLHLNNPGMRFEIDIDSLPLDEKAAIFCRANGLPVGGLLYGGAGEYELLFALPQDMQPNIEATKIGSAQPSSQPGMYYRFGDRVKAIDQPPACPRSFADREDYIKAILEQSLRIFTTNC